MLFVCKTFLTIFLIVAVTFTVTLAAADDDEIGLFTSDNKVDCVNKMVDWCKSMKYPKDGSGMSMLSIAMTDESGVFWRYFCASDSDGTNCTRNRSPWFSCSSENNFFYNGVELKKDSTDGVDDEICNTTKKAFNDLFIQNLFVNPTNLTTEINKGMETFFETLADIQEQLDLFRKLIFNDCFPYCKNNPGVIYPTDTEGREPVTQLPVSGTNDQGNQLERE